MVKRKPVNAEAESAPPAEPAVAKAKRVRKAVAKQVASPVDSVISKESAGEPSLPTHPEVTAKKRAKTVRPDDSPVTEHKKEKGKKKEKKKDKKKKEAVLIRFEKDQLRQIDSRADSLGLTRAAWVRMTVARELAGG